MGNAFFLPVVQRVLTNVIICVILQVVPSKTPMVPEMVFLFPSQDPHRDNRDGRRALDGERLGRTNRSAGSYGQAFDWARSRITIRDY